MKPVITGHCERYELRVAKTDRTCWTWQERGGSTEEQCTRVIAAGETYLLSTLYPGHDSGMLDDWVRWQSGEWDSATKTFGPGRWVRVKSHPVDHHFCLPCTKRWQDLERAVARIAEAKVAAA